MPSASDNTAPLVEHMIPLTGTPYGETAANPFATEAEAAKMHMRHPSTTGLLRFFEFEHLPPHLQTVSRSCHQLAHAMVEDLPDGPELTTGLRKLLEAKDCFVRAALPR